MRFFIMLIISSYNILKLFYRKVLECQVGGFLRRFEVICILNVSFELGRRKNGRELDRIYRINGIRLTGLFAIDRSAQE